MSNCTSNSTIDLTRDPTSDPTSDSTSEPTSHPRKNVSTNREPLGDFRYCSVFDGYCGFGHFKGFCDFGIIATPVIFGFAPESALLLSGFSTEIPIEQRPQAESIPKAEYSFKTRRHPQKYPVSEQSRCSDIDYIDAGSGWKCC